MANEMERAGAKISMGGKGDTAVVARQTTTGALTWGCSKQENFREAQGRKE